MRRSIEPIVPPERVAEFFAGGARLLALAFMPLAAGELTGRPEAIFIVFAALLAMMSAWVNRHRIEAALARLLLGRRDEE